MSTPPEHLQLHTHLSHRLAEITANTRRWHSVGLMLGQHRGRCTNITQTLHYRVCCELSAI